MRMEEKIEIEKDKLYEMIINNNENLHNEMIQRQSRKIDQLIVRYLKSGRKAMKVITN